MTVDDIIEKCKTCYIAGPPEKSSIDYNGPTLEDIQQSIPEGLSDELAKRILKIETERYISTTDHTSQEQTLTMQAMLEYKRKHKTNSKAQTAISMAIYSCQTCSKEGLDKGKYNTATASNFLTDRKGSIPV